MSATRPEDDLDYLAEEDEDEEEETAPFAANAENRALDKAVREAERSVLRTGAEVEEQKNRVKVMTDHLGSVQQELQHTQVSARKEG